MTTNGTPVLALSVAGIMAASPMGFPMETIVLATGFTLLGIVGRLGFEISKAAEQPGVVKWSSVAALFGGSILSSVPITVLYLALLKTAGIQSDTASVIGCIFLGFTGPKAFIWLYNSLSGWLGKRTGLTFPQIGADGAQKP